MWFVFALSSALLSATAAVFEKKALFKLSALHFSFLLAIANALISIPFLWSSSFFVPDVKGFYVVGFKALMGSISFLLVMNGIKRLELSSALPILVITPGLVALLAWILLDDFLSGFDIIGMLLLLAGTYFLQVGKLANTLKPFRLINQPKAYWYIFGAVLIFTATSLIDKWLLSDYKMPPTVLVPIQHFFMAIYFSLFLLVRPTEKKDLNVALKSGWKLILIVSFLTILYRYGHILAIKEGSVALAISVKRTSVFFAALIGGYLFKETNLIYKLFATLIMIAGAVLIIVG
jgi:drug/metabolite transporter (DMT)-like permease